VIGILAPMSAIVHRVANMAGACVVNVIAFGAGAAIQTTVVSALLSRAQLGGMNLLVLVLCLVSTLVAFVLLLPLLSLTNIVGLSSGGRGVHAMRRAGQVAVRYAATRKAFENADRGSSGSDPGLSSGGSRPGTAGAHAFRGAGPPAESFGRPEPGPPPPVGEVPAETHIGRHRPRFPVAALPEGSLADDVRPEGMPAGDSRPGPSPGGSSLTRDLVPLEGVVVHHPPGRMPEATLVHDSETVIAADGVGPRLFDPATKSSVRTDRNGNVIGQGVEA